jgi:hypothetical protein
MERTNSEGQPTKLVLAQTCMGVFFIRSVSDTIFAMPFPTKPPTDSHGLSVVSGPQFEKHWRKYIHENRGGGCGSKLSHFISYSRTRNKSGVS